METDWKCNRSYNTLNNSLINHGLQYTLHLSCFAQCVKLYIGSEAIQFAPSRSLQTLGLLSHPSGPHILSYPSPITFCRSLELILGNNRPLCPLASLQITLHGLGRGCHFWRSYIAEPCLIACRDAEGWSSLVFFPNMVSRALQKIGGNSHPPSHPSVSHLPSEDLQSSH